MEVQPDCGPHSGEGKDRQIGSQGEGWLECQLTLLREVGRGYCHIPGPGTADPEILLRREGGAGGLIPRHAEYGFEIGRAQVGRSPKGEGLGSGHLGLSLSFSIFEPNFPKVMPHFLILLVHIHFYVNGKDIHE